MQLLAPAMDLNAEQRRAVRFSVALEGGCLNGPLLVLAGAGSGKTSVIAHRVARLVESGADRNRILLLTFTRLAAAEMTQRVAGLINEPSRRGPRGPIDVLPWAGTFHAIGRRLLRLHADKIDLDPSFTILDAYAARTLMGAVRKDLGFDGQHRDLLPAGDCLAIQSFKVNSRTGLTDVLERHWPDYVDRHADLDALFAAYSKAKRVQNVVDFDDLLRLWLRLMRKPKTGRRIGRLWDHILVDEFQDTNKLQAAILRRLKPDGSGLTVVGDDAQAIYGFRAADVHNILGFSDQFVPPAKVVTLVTNYRSTAAILDAANAVIDLALAGHKKRLMTPKGARTGPKPALVTVADDGAQAQFVVDKVLANRKSGMLLAEQAVLVRIGTHSTDVEAECRRRKIAFVKFGGHAFIDRDGVRDMLAVLAWAENPRDHTSAARLIGDMPGIGDKITRRFIASIEGTKIITALREFNPPTSAEAAWSDLLSLMRKLRNRETSWPEQIKAVRLWMRARAKPQGDDANASGRDIDTLLGVAERFACRQEFLANFALDPPDPEAAGAGGDRLVIATIHAVKGREFEAVFVLNVVDGALPNGRSVRDPDLVAEERRLLYVAMTRAKRLLTLLMPVASAHVQPTTRPLGNRPPVANRTRFITRDLLNLFDQQDLSQSQ